MAEMLPRLFSEIRSRRPRIQYQPFQGFSGSAAGQVGGLRDTMPANALDTQSATDIAQGIDLDSLAPTRLQSGRIDPEAYATETQDTAGSRAAPITLASNPSPQSGRICIDGKCYPSGMEPMQSLPPGVVLEPGQTFVEGSYRETPMAATTGTATTVGPAAPQQQRLVAALDANKPSTFFDLAQQQVDDARSFAAQQLPYQTKMAYDLGRDAIRNGMMATVLLKKKEIADLTDRMATRAMDQRDTQLAIEQDKVGLEREKLGLERDKHLALTGELRVKMENDIRSMRDLPVAQRAQRIVDQRIADTLAGTNGALNLAGHRDQDILAEVDTIYSMDLSHFVGEMHKAAMAHNKLVSSGATPQQILNAARNYAALQGEVTSRLRERYKDYPDAAKREVDMRGDLIGPYQQGFERAFRELGVEASSEQALAAATITVQNQIADMDRISASNYDPFESLFGVIKPQATRNDAPQPQPQVITPGTTTSGSGLDSMSSFGGDSTMSLAR